MFSVIALALAAASGGPADEASAAARRCDTPAYEAAVGRIEDQALGDMKAANEAVALAARAGAVGTAGDAEWNAYKADLALAEQVRLANAPALAACQRPSRAQGAPGPPPAEPTATRHVRIGVSEGRASADIHSTTAIPILNQSGLYAITSSIPNTPVTFPGGTFTATTSTPTGNSVRLKSRAWENQLRVGATFASGGFDAPGWRLSGTLGFDSGTIHERLARPLAAAAPNIDLAATAQVSCVVFSAFSGQCFDYALAVPFTGQALQIPGPFGPPFASRVNSYDVRQSVRRFSAEAGAERVFGLASPLGDLDLALGADIGARWWSFDMTRAIDADTIQFSNHNRGQGPGFSAKAKLAIGGRVGGWPLRWTLFGDYGAEWVDLTIHDDQNFSAVLNRTRPVYDLGGALEYDLSKAISLTFMVKDERVPYLSSFLASGRAPGAFINDGSGTFFTLLDANALSYSVMLGYSF